MSNADDRFTAISTGLKRRSVIAAVPDPDPDAEPDSTSAAARVVPPDHDPAPAESTADGRSSSGRRTNPQTSMDNTPAATPASVSTGGTRRVAFRVPGATDLLLRNKVRADETSKVHVILDAIEHTVESGATLTFEQPSKSKSSMFVRPRTPGNAMPTVQTEIVLDAGSLATIDNLAERHGAPTRTAFVLACLDAYLPDN